MGPKKHPFCAERNLARKLLCASPFESPFAVFLNITMIEILKPQIWVLFEDTLERVLWATGAAYFELVTSGRHAQYCV
jgi:hypothetical protein